MNLLIVEDDISLASEISRVFLTYQSIHRITVIDSPLEFVKRLDTLTSYDIILTDLILSPDDTTPWGYRVIEKIREKNKDIPIIVISGKWDIHILREAFQLGATDYLIKPFRLKELEVRVNHWFENYCFPGLKKQKKWSIESGLAYDREKNQFILSGNVITLSKSLKYLLLIFYSNQGVLVSSDLLRDKIWWDYEVRRERNLRIYIMRLRRILSEVWLRYTLINTRWEGYIFTLL